VPDEAEIALDDTRYPAPEALHDWRRGVHVLGVEDRVD